MTNTTSTPEPTEPWWVNARILVDARPLPPSIYRQDGHGRGLVLSAARISNQAEQWRSGGWQLQRTNWKPILAVGITDGLALLARLHENTWVRGVLVEGVEPDRLLELAYITEYVRERAHDKSPQGWRTARVYTDTPRTITREAHKHIGSPIWSNKWKWDTNPSECPQK